MTHVPGQVAIPEQEKKNKFGKIGAKVSDIARNRLTSSLVILPYTERALASELPSRPTW
jgi:hypothetical protein